MTGTADGHELTGADPTRKLAALSSPHRLRIVAALVAEPVHVSGLARAVGLSRPLVHMHLQRLEAAGLVSGRLELSDDGKALKFYEVVPFALHLTPDVVATASTTLEDRPPTEREEPA